MNRLKSRLFGAFVLAVMLIFATGTAFSQTDNTKDHKMYKVQDPGNHNTKYSKAVSSAASVLRDKINLSMEQTGQVEGILQDYKQNLSNKNMTASKSKSMDKIEAVLTADQKAKFDNVKMQWWTDTQQKLTSNSDMKKSHSVSKTDTTNWKK